MTCDLCERSAADIVLLGARDDPGHTGIVFLCDYHYRLAVPRDDAYPVASCSCWLALVSAIERRRRAASETGVQVTEA
jgi:hypothetical protein